MVFDVKDGAYVTTKHLKTEFKSMRKSELVDELLLLVENYPEIKKHYTIKYASPSVKYELYYSICQTISHELEPKNGLPGARIDFLKENIRLFNIRVNDYYFQACVHLYFSGKCLQYLINYKDFVFDPIDNEVINELRAFLKIMSAHDYKGLEYSLIEPVNFIVRHSGLYDKDLYQRVMHSLEKYNYPPNKIEKI